MLTHSISSKRCLFIFLPNMINIKVKAKSLSIITSCFVLLNLNNWWLCWGWCQSSFEPVCFICSVLRWTHNCVKSSRVPSASNECVWVCVRACEYIQYCMCMNVWTCHSPLPDSLALSGLTRVIHNTFMLGSQQNIQPFITTSITIRLHRAGTMVSPCSSGFSDHPSPCWPFIHPPAHTPNKEPLGIQVWSAPIIMQNIIKKTWTELRICLSQ